jgi:hypothetical protein
MKIKPKDVQVNLPIVLMFDDEDEAATFASNINTLLHGKSKVKNEILGMLDDKYVSLFYLQRNIESQYLRDEFMNLILKEEFV